MYSLEFNLYVAEIYLSVVTAIPVLGVVGGAAKVSLGLIQTVSALAITLFAGIAAPCSEKGRAYCLRATKHIVHGMGNIFAGIIESIPLVGLASGYIRYKSYESAHPAGPGAANYIAYGDLYKRGSFFNEVISCDIGWSDTSPLPLIKV